MVNIVYVLCPIPQTVFWLHTGFRVGWEFCGVLGISVGLLQYQTNFLDRTYRVGVEVNWRASELLESSTVIESGIWKNWIRSVPIYAHPLSPTAIYLFLSGCSWSCDFGLFLRSTRGTVLWFFSLFSLTLNSNSSRIVIRRSCWRRWQANTTWNFRRADDLEKWIWYCTCFPLPQRNSLWHTGIDGLEFFVCFL